MWPFLRGKNEKTDCTNRAILSAYRWFGYLSQQQQQQ